VAGTSLAAPREGQVFSLMSSHGKRFDDVIAAIDDANARDPKTVGIDGRTVPAELLYGQRMSEALARMAANASELLRIAVRGQHIERWTSPRSSYPVGRVGYLKWRNDLKDYHARRLGEIMTAAGYGPQDAARVGALVRKERLRSDPEAQMLEDVACIVFLTHYLADFMGKTDEAKLARILVQTWNKMSAQGRSHAEKLDLPPSVLALLERGLKQARKGPNS
jgi:Domain of unknown function (DUF4202)